MSKKTYAFYAYGFFLSSFLLLISAIFEIVAPGILSLVCLFGLIFSFPFVFLVSRVKRKKKPVSCPLLGKNFSLNRLIFIFSAAFFLIFAFLLLGRPGDKFYRSGSRQLVSLPTQAPLPTVLPTQSLDKESENLVFHKPSFRLKKPLIFLTSPTEKKLKMLIYDNGAKREFTFVYNDDENVWQNQDKSRSPSYNLHHQGFYKGAYYKYQYQSDKEGLVSLEDMPYYKHGYGQECVQTEQGKLCFVKRSIYHASFENRAYPWDGRFFYEDGEEILKFDYSDLQIVWSDPKGFCDEDCFSSYLVGYFDDYSKALLELVTEHGKWQGGDGSGWFGFYLADLKNGTLRPFRLPGFGPGQTGQQDPCLVVPGRNLLVYFKNQDRLVAYNLTSGQEKIIKRFDEKIDDKWYVTRLNNIKDRYVYLQGDWLGTKYFYRYFDLEKMTELEAHETPVFVKNPGGFWNHDDSQYVWQDKDRIRTYVWDLKLDKVDLVARQESDDRTYYLSGWGR